MNFQRAIERIKIHNEHHSQKEPFSIYTTEALNMAIEALEKQIPKKPNYEYEQTGNGISSVIRFPICPSCNGIDDGQQYSVGGNEKFCCICGQALDWSDTE